MSPALRIIFATAFLFAASRSALPQSVPLPSELKSSFEPYGPFAAFMALPVPDPQIAVQARFWFENTGVRKGVGASWTVLADGKPVASREDFFDTSFRPTAVCQRSGKGTKLYVAGWAERLGAVVVEEWEFVDYSIAGSHAPRGRNVGAAVRPRWTSRSENLASLL